MKPTRILFQGDSITDGNRYKDEASRWDQNHQIGHSYAFIAAGSMGARYPERHLQFFNRGVSGDTVQRLDTRWEDAALLMHPSFISILIGTNDVSRCLNENRDPDAFCTEYERLYRRILDRSLEEDPAVRFILMEPFRLILPERGELPRQQTAASVLAQLQGAVRRIAAAIVQAASARRPRTLVVPGAAFAALAWLARALPAGLTDRLVARHYRV